MNLRITEHCKLQGITLQDLADKMGVARSTLANTLSKGNPTIGTLEKIAEALGVDFLELFAKESRNEQYYNLIHQIRIGNRFLNYGGGNVIAIKHDPLTTYVELTNGLFSIDELICISLDNPIFEALDFSTTFLTSNTIQFTKENVIVSKILDFSGIKYFIKNESWAKDQYEIRYLHELQNWFFLLTKKELDISML